MAHLVPPRVGFVGIVCARAWTVKESSLTPAAACHKCTRAPLRRTVRETLHQWDLHRHVHFVCAVAGYLWRPICHQPAALA